MFASVGYRSSFSAGRSAGFFVFAIVDSFSFVTRGLDPRVHPFREEMDCRVKPGNDSE
jgi:hypothetical protein